MSSTETKAQLKKKKVAFHDSRRVTDYVVFVGVEWASVCSYCGMRSLCAQKQTTLFWF